MIYIKSRKTKVSYVKLNTKRTEEKYNKTYFYKNKLKKKKKKNKRQQLNDDFLVNFLISSKISSQNESIYII